MIVGVPKEIKNEEYRVAVTPIGVREFVRAGHGVLVEKGAGVGSGFADGAYVKAGAKMAPAAEVFAKRRDDRQGQGAAGHRVARLRRRPDPVHLPAPGRRQGARPRAC